MKAVRAAARIGGPKISFTAGRLGRVRRRLHDAALLVALGGTAYAANTVRGRDVVDGSLKSKDIQDGAIRGQDIKEPEGARQVTIRNPAGDLVDLGTGPSDPFGFSLVSAC